MLTHSLTGMVLFQSRNSHVINPIQTYKAGEKGHGKNSIFKTKAVLVLPQRPQINVAQATSHISFTYLHFCFPLLVLLNSPVFDILLNLFTSKKLTLVSIAVFGNNIRLLALN